MTWDQFQKKTWSQIKWSILAFSKINVGGWGQIYKYIADVSPKSAQKRSYDV